MKTSLIASVSALALLVAPISNAVEVFSTDFETGAPPEIGGSGGVEGTQGYSGFGFDQNFWRNDSAGGATTLTLGGLPAHSALSLFFSFAAIDSWDGETVAGGTVPPDVFNVRINGDLVFSETFDNFLLTDGSYSGAPITSGSDIFTAGTQWPDSAYALAVTVPHTANNAAVEWFVSGGGWQAGNDESFAIDNIRVNVRETDGQVPEATSTITLLGAALLGIAGLKARKH